MLRHQDSMFSSGWPQPGCEMRPRHCVSGRAESGKRQSLFGGAKHHNQSELITPHRTSATPHSLLKHSGPSMGVYSGSFSAILGCEGPAAGARVFSDGRFTYEPLADAARLADDAVLLNCLLTCSHDLSISLAQSAQQHHLISLGCNDVVWRHHEKASTFLASNDWQKMPRAA